MMVVTPCHTLKRIMWSDLPSEGWDDDLSTWHQRGITRSHTHNSQAVLVLVFSWDSLTVRKILPMYPQWSLLCYQEMLIVFCWEPHQWRKYVSHCVSSLTSIINNTSLVERVLAVFFPINSRPHKIFQNSSAIFAFTYLSTMKRARLISIPNISQI